MARKTTVTLIDDLDGSALPEGTSPTAFSFRGTAYEIDLSPENAEELAGALKPYIDAARRTSGGRGSANRSSSRSAGNAERLTAIREWAAANGHQVAARGRIKSTIVEAYEAAH